MKKATIIISFFILSIYANGQSDTGIFIQRDFKEIASIKGIKVEVMIKENLLTNDSIKVIRVSYDGNVVALQAEEIDTYVHFLKIIEYRATAIKPKFDDSEITYITPNEFETGCYYNGYSWIIYMDLKDKTTSYKVARQTRVVLSLESLATYIKALNEAKYFVNSL